MSIGVSLKFTILCFFGRCFSGMTGIDLNIFFVTFLARPKKGDAKEGRPAKILYGMLGRPRYISETCPAGFGHLKCLTLGLGRPPKFSHGLKGFNEPRPHAEPVASDYECAARMQAIYAAMRAGVQKKEKDRGPGAFR